MPHILTGNVQSITFRCRRQNKVPTRVNLQNPLRSNCQCMHNPSHNCKTDHSGFHAYETHRHVMQQNENSAKLMTADIKTAQTRPPNSVQSEIVQNPEISKNDNKRVNKNFQDISKLQIHSSLSWTALCTAFCIFHCNCRSSLPELSVTTQLVNTSKIYTRQSMVHALLNNFHGFRSKLVQEVAILIELQSLHGSLPAIFVGFIFQKDAFLGFL